MESQDHISEAKAGLEQAPASLEKQSLGPPTPLLPHLITLSMLPKTQWQNLIHLDAIKVTFNPVTRLFAEAFLYVGPLREIIKLHTPAISLQIDACRSVVLTAQLLLQILYSFKWNLTPGGICEVFLSDSSFLQERSKPVQPPKKPEAAPFFLPTVATLSSNPVFDAAPANAEVNGKLPGWGEDGEGTSHGSMFHDVWPNPEAPDLLHLSNPSLL